MSAASSHADALEAFDAAPTTSPQTAGGRPQSHRDTAAHAAAEFSEFTGRPAPARRRPHVGGNARAGGFPSGRMGPATSRRGWHPVPDATLCRPRLSAKVSAAR